MTVNNLMAYNPDINRVQDPRLLTGINYDLIIDK